AVAQTRPRARAPPARFCGVLPPRQATRGSWCRCAESNGCDPSLRACRDARGIRGGRVREGARVSRLRAKCPDCRTLTAVALGPEYECHSCGRTFGAGLVRVPRAWGDGGEVMIASASLPFAYPEAAVIEEPTLGEQNLAVASELPERPLILGGCCCSHVGAIEGLAARHDRLGVIWLDAHGDL